MTKATGNSGEDIRERAFEFACRVVTFCEALWQAGGVARLMAPQLLGCSTAVAAMLEEARAAEVRELRVEADALVSILMTIVRNTRAGSVIPNF